MARGVVAKWPWPVGPESPEGFTRGGYIRRGVYCVQRSFPCVEPDGSTGTRRLDVSLRQTEPKAAYDELLRFLADPFNWKPAASPEKVVGLFLDRSLTEDFLAWSRDTRKNTEQWRRDRGACLRGGARDSQASIFERSRCATTSSPP